jgi:glutamate/tyrosine decarboxylase-like PLP-dependent enzyme
MIKDINYTRIIPVEFDQEICNFSLEKGAFSKLVEEDISKGLIPFWVGATYGSTPTCAYDDLSEIV